ncbi:MAG: S46 family peptidase [Elusimicrobia bacterium]|nr:S46 family peptidase [Elusimicrobiota bacterium]
MNPKTAAAVVAAAITLAPTAHADEGMWTLDNIPAAQLKSRYGFEATPEWLDHVRLSSVRFNDGGSGSFVSPDGLVLTNHHVALGQLQKVSSEKKDFVKDGFYARHREDELKCPDLELNQLVSMDNVTERVLSAIDRSMPDKEQNEQRKGAMAKIEKESTDQTGLRSDVIELYQGGEYWVYRYKKYTDIRLVMAPEQQAAFYGGDPDNFTFPRFDIDMAFFRVYEDGKPVHPKNFLKWSKAGAKENDLVFVTGHPGSTDRLRTVRQLEYQRDYYLPTFLRILNSRRRTFYAFSERGPEAARRAKDKIFGFENAIKAYTGELEGLKDPKLLGRLSQREKELRAALDKKPDLYKSYGKAWDRIAKAQNELIKRHEQVLYRRFFGSKLADFAKLIVLYVAEVEKPNDKRYEEFRESALESLNFRLFSPAPIYSDLEEYVIADILQEQLEILGAQDAHVKAALAGKSPKEVAHEIVSGTRLTDAAYRKELVKGGRTAVESATDPMIVWMRRLEGPYRELRKWYEDDIQAPESLEGNKIAKSRFALYGKSTYPDATFTLRLSYGRVAGYELGTTKIPAKTTFYGLYDRSASFDDQFPFNLPPLVAAARKKVDLTVPLNFVTTNDIIGGNSGSPVINRDGEYVGLIFDGNIQSLVWRYAYDDMQGRAVAVHSAGIVEALKRIYAMDALAAELTGR